MRVFERADSRWEIEISEQRVVARRFVGDALADDASSSHSSALRAKWEADRFCAHLAAQGFTRAVDEIPPLGKAELEDALRADPEDPETYLVYADWLSERGDDWGQLIAIQHAQRTLPRGGEALRRDELARMETMLRFRLGARLWGRLGETVFDEPTQKYWCDLIDATWDCGFLRAVQIRYVDADVFVELIDGLHALPIASVLREIVLVDDDWVPEAIDAFASRKWPQLRRLVVAGRFEVRRLLPALAHTPELTSLTLQAGLFDGAIDELAKLSLPKLEKLELTGSIPGDAYARLRHLARSVRVISDA